jgi:hypothetical protein
MRTEEEVRKSIAKLEEQLKETSVGSRWEAIRCGMLAAMRWIVEDKPSTPPKKEEVEF